MLKLLITAQDKPATGKRLVQAIITLLCLTLLMSVQIPIAAADANKPEPIAIKVGFDLWPGYFPMVIAKQRGLFAKRNLDVTYSVPENTNLMLSQFVEKELDAICVAVGDVLSIIEQTPDSRVTMIADLSAGGDALLTMSPLPKRLNGLRIGTNLNGFGELFVREFLRDRSTRVSRVKLVNIDASQAKDLLLSGEVDIAHTWQPYVSEAIAEGARVVFTSRQTPGLIPDVVAFNGDFIKQHPQAVADFNAAWMEALDWWKANPHKGNRMIWLQLNLAKPVSLSGIMLMDAKNNRDAFNNRRSPRSLPRVLDRYIDFYLSRDLLKKKIRYKDVIDGSFLPKAAEE